MKHLISLLLFAFLLTSSTAAKTVRKSIVATEAGIPSDGKTLGTTAIQSAIDRLSQQGGGRLTFSPGTYLTGCIVLKSGVELHLEQGAVLSGSTDPDDYHSLIDSEASDNSTLALIVADGVHDVAITGSGLIDGNGRDLALNIDSLLNLPTADEPLEPRRRRRASETLRPKLIFVSGSSDIHIEGLNLLNSACWGLSFHACQRLRIHDIRFENRAYWNNDGIDVTDCKDVTISRCDINSADDGICLKSYDPQSCNENILIEDCQIRSSASAVKFGTASWGGFKHITVRNIRVRDTFRSAIALECVDGGTMEDVLVEDIHATNTGNPIFVRLGHRGSDHAGAARRITIRRVFVEMTFGVPDIDYDLRGPGFSVYNPRPSSITGIPGHCVEDILLEDIELVYPGRASKGIYYYPLNQIHQVPEQEGSYPEFSMFGELPSWGFYVRHARGITLRNVRLSLKDEDFRPALIFDDVRDIRLSGFSIPTRLSGQPYYLRESTFAEE